MIKVGITGDMGSGKTTVCRVFQHLDVSVFDSDNRAKQLYDKEDVKEKICLLFGDGLLSDRGEVDRKKLGQLVFSDPKRLQALNAMIHPLVLEEYEKWTEKHKKERYTLFESALLYSCNLTHLFDKIIFVEASQDVRIRRVMERDNTSLSHVWQRIEQQSFEKNELFKPDYFIFN
ncbi:MAG: dephospho-CoA kinase, partial [Bacteroidales bacterium]|nr:dephospho-CoA kinase [Bacteroidales bacterium]